MGAFVGGGWVSFFPFPPPPGGLPAVVSLLEQLRKGITARDRLRSHASDLTTVWRGTGEKTSAERRGVAVRIDGRVLMHA